MLPLGVSNGAKSQYKKNNYSPKKEARVRGRRLFFAIFLLNKIAATIFQIIYIQNKALNPCVNGGLERRRKVQTRLQGLFTFWH